jgi:transposase-like protein
MQRPSTNSLQTLLDAMIYRRISSDMKQRALRLVDEGWEMEDVANVLGVASKSIGRWTTTTMPTGTDT